ncbi:hypothetical protein N9S81_00265 [bacterium]|nr:hypothetical protein [bacterium]
MSSSESDDEEQQQQPEGEGEGVHINGMEEEDEEEDAGDDDDEKTKKKTKSYGVRRADGFVGPAGSVSWHEQNKKYQAQARDRRTGEQPFVGYYETEAEARAALRVKQAELDATFEATDETFQAGVAATEGLPASPDDIADAIPGKPYRHQSYKTKFVPYAVVVQRNAGNQRGLQWHPACTHVDLETGEKWTCGQEAVSACDGTPARFCQRHGGGKRCKGATLFKTGVYHACEYNVGVHTGKGDHYDGMCVRCFCVTADPNSERVKNAGKWMNAKEQEVVKRLMAVFKSKYHFVLDEAYGKKYAYGSLQKNFRPDMRTIQHGRILIVEIDELSHKTYDCGRERFREEVLRKQGGDRMRTVMLRFNPDQYTDVATGDRIPSCFHRNKKENTVVPNPREKKQWDMRIEALCERIRVFLDPTNLAYMDDVPDPPPGRAIYMEELFYDDISGVTDADKAKIRECFKKGAVKKKRKAAEVAEVAA